MSLLFFTVYRTGQLTRVRTELSAVGDRKFYEIEEALHQEITIISALKAFFESSSRVDPDEFQTFTRTFLKENRAVQWLAWSPVVGHEARTRFAT
ncbi:MAG: CHASE domain-containing protein, partial [Desulfobacterales bacterium]|nr:CHASE domain-containing protein [Desulfobacterales bacterium]